MDALIHDPPATLQNGRRPVRFAAMLVVALPLVAKLRQPMENRASGERVGWHAVHAHGREEALDGLNGGASWRPSAIRRINLVLLRSRGRVQLPGAARASSVSSTGEGFRWQATRSCTSGLGPGRRAASGFPLVCVCGPNRKEFGKSTPSPFERVLHRQHPG